MHAQREEVWVGSIKRGFPQEGAFVMITRDAHHRLGADLWGCLGVWYSGRWYTDAAVGYMNLVQSDLAQRVWTTPNFLSYG